MVNFPPDHCPCCGAELAAVDGPTVHRCESCEDYVFHNPVPGGSVAVVDGDSLLLVEDFRYEKRWKLPSGAIEVGESPREGAIRELEEETNVSVEPANLRYFHDSAVEPVEGKHLTNVSFAAPRAVTTGAVEAGSDATDARFWTPDEFTASEHSFTPVHVDRFGSDSLDWLLDEAQAALEVQEDPPTDL
ncbi:NUDIX hydrolase [Halobacteriales archaeon SW_6_65_15]|nr:MAG: NUDIX hydrolase [Halobacteriales archaeon SW_6_65_15]